MVSIKIDSKLNKDVEKAVNEISKLKYSKEILYKAARRFNDRIYAAKHKKKLQKKQQNKKCPKKRK